ncbi:BAG family molecular chaperone regulator 2-like isoform X3 [Protopterus annectens]|uniref:BAG family molecular chaperone regulator 2-like isoform X3 n=1 Tax=Protopterus annectens TaxID=7888 RepID=UPI001CFB39A4|nr:BAG family molecular chaperone regulator 2-like isoform X3 [Protopterus annectens]XP_043934121.1 BAG family molecular chaperone regulator 2-like isoform X3 [Protopterus annectens]
MGPLDTHSSDVRDEHLPDHGQSPLMMIQTIAERRMMTRKLDLHMPSSLLYFRGDSARHHNKTIIRSRSGEREELTLLTDQLMIRTDAVHIGLGTVRSEQQEESLRQVTALLEDLSQELIEGGRTGKAQLESYLNACLSHGDERHADEKFQALVISCALEDQKIIRKRLESMVRHS